MENFSTILNVGAVGVCLVALAFWYIRREGRYDKLVEERIAQEQKFREDITSIQEKYRKEVGDILERYRAAMLKFEQTLDSLIRMTERR